MGWKKSFPLSVTEAWGRDAHGGVGGAEEAVTDCLAFSNEDLSLGMTGEAGC